MGHDAQTWPIVSAPDALLLEVLLGAKTRARFDGPVRLVTVSFMAAAQHLCIKRSSEFSQS